MRRHKQRTEVRYEDGWLYLRSGKNAVAIQVRSEDESSQESVVCEAAMPLLGAKDPHMADKLLRGISLDLPQTWHPDETSNMQVVDQAAFYEETFSPNCRSNDALRRALRDMPSEVAHCLLSAKPEERLQCFSKDGQVTR